MLVRLGVYLRSFRDDTFGGITALTLTVFLVMVISVGMAVDFMRHETYRAELQDALDRGVLAAAAFNQSVDPETTIRTYMKSTSFIRDGYNLDVPTPVISEGKRVIKATASYSVKTFFLKLVGIPTIDIQATGTAIEGASKVEISLVLDISTSMVIYNSGGTSDTRLKVLQNSANQFLDKLFVPSNNDRLSLSLIPFSGQVNIGRPAFDYLTNNRIHSYSNCVEFGAGDFSYVENGQTDSLANPLNTMMQLPALNTLTQMQHFNFSKFVHSDGSIHYGPENSSIVDWGWCPTDQQAITYHETNKAILKDRIDNLRTHEATGSHYGIKWGAMLLDPSSRGLTAAVDGTNAPVSGPGGTTVATTEPMTGTTPGDYGKPEDVQKFLIIMSDGATTGQMRLKDHLYDEVTEYEYYDQNLAANQSAEFEYVGLDGNAISGGAMVDGSWTSDPGVASREAARTAFRQVCETAKDNGVVVFAIGFDLDPDPATATQSELDAAARAKSDLSACASSSFFFDVRGTQLEKAFAEIASIIQKLRLLN